MKRLLAILLLTIFVQLPILAQSEQTLKVRQSRISNEANILSEFIQLLSIPNLASDRANIQRNADLIVEMMKRRGLSPQLLNNVEGTSPPAVYGEWKVPGATKTLIFYAHYDGQPVTVADWTGSAPWQPTLRTNTLENKGEIVTIPASGPINPEWRLYGRSTSDDKAGVMAILTAVDALRKSGLQPAANIKFFFDGEEEAGSPHLKDIATHNKVLLGSDAWIICDGPVHQSGLKQVVFGVRGDVNVDVTVYGAKRPLHSGHYGNWSPNPAMTLARLLASMKDANGRVTIAGWYDDVTPLNKAEIAAIADAPRYDAEIMKALGIAKNEGGGKLLLEQLMLPSLNINGFKSGDVGNLSRNVIPTTATAALDLRLVKGNDVERQIAKLNAHIKKLGFYVIARDPTDVERQQYPLMAKFTKREGGYNASRTSMELPVSKAVIAAVRSTTKDKVVALPSLGGSLPLSVLEESLNAITITVPIANYDNNQHAENENIRIQNFWDGIETMAALMVMRY